ncbi:MAG: ATP-binding cassette domain-containing protein, partial [Candidatus Aegiribacteria sp.]|nr:ATP-binding cassette domain-containing protein [Candidatus Aegiribacteria sp.]MBD3295209.1 ATP-binding cassette domain-containing protein [Candidatus Fermentibacteria bacterium]
MKKGGRMAHHPLRVVDLAKTFQKKLGLSSFKAVDSVSFILKRGEILGFLGPNGAGKTTTIKCILGLLKPSGGSVDLWGGKPAEPSVRRRIGYVPENPDYEDIFTPMEYLVMFSSMRGLSMKNETMMAILERVGLCGWENQRLRSFSKGMRQRLSLALALQAKPDLLIMDEPTGGLDPVARKEFRDIILEENRRGASIFLSSHLLSEVETICSRAVILARGEKVAEGQLEDLLRTEDLFRITYLLPGEEVTEEKEMEVRSEILQKTLDGLRDDGYRIIGVNP